MGVIIINSYTGGGSVPLAASVDGASLIDVVDVIGPQLQPTPAVVTFANQGGFDATVIATGGTGVYTYSWVVNLVNEQSDIFPPTNRFAINTTGTTNAARYNTLTVDGARPALATDAPFDATFEAICTVDDGVSTIDVIVGFVCQGITVP